MAKRPPPLGAEGQGSQSLSLRREVHVPRAKPGVVRVTFCPKPFGPIPDRDNAIAAFQGGSRWDRRRLGVNDRDMIVTHEFGNRCKDGAVIVDILPVEATVSFPGIIG